MPCWCLKSNLSLSSSTRARYIRKTHLSQHYTKRSHSHTFRRMIFILWASSTNFSARSPSPFAVWTRVKESSWPPPIIWKITESNGGESFRFKNEQSLLLGTEAGLYVQDFTFLNNKIWWSFKILIYLESSKYVTGTFILYLSLIKRVQAARHPQLSSLPLNATGNFIEHQAKGHCVPNASRHEVLMKATVIIEICVHSQVFSGSMDTVNMRWPFE